VRFRTEAMTSRAAPLAIVDASIAALALATDAIARSNTLATTFDALSTKRNDFAVYRGSPPRGRPAGDHKKKCNYGSTTY
jgi:hypothetical protein